MCNFVVGRMRLAYQRDAKENGTRVRILDKGRTSK